ncbi:MAG: putative bifunctional diguanylate cyclase/phosphodiesterase [Acidiferrobacterales bacterium]
MFKPLRRVWIAGSLSIVIVAFGLYTLYCQGVQRMTAQQATSANLAVAMILTNSFGASFQGILRESGRAVTRQLPQNRHSGQVRREVRSLIRGLDITGVQLLALNGLTVFSVGQSEVNALPAHRTQFAAALAGRATSVVRLDNRSSMLARIIPASEGVVSFLPIRASPAGSVQGIMVIRSGITGLAWGLGAQQLWLVAAAVASLFALYAGVVLIKKRSGSVSAAQGQSHPPLDYRARRQIYQDSLTGLPNRASLTEHVRRMTGQRGKSIRMFCVMLIDLDRFKVINDSLGHETGDQLLREAAIRIRHSVRDSDPVFRMGGDEFAVLMDSLERVEDAARLAQRIIDQIGEPVLLGGHEITPGASIGIALYPKDGTTAEHLIKDADAAMYRAKESGRNRYEFFTRDMNVRAMERLSLETSLQRALRNEEFILFYQPRVLLATGCIIGTEALLRWNHPQSGILTPDKFLSVLEESEMIVSVGTWVLRTACLQNVAWQAQGLPPVRVSVNISSRQFRNGSLAKTVSSILQSTGLSPEWLELELTESLLMEDTDAAIEMMRQIKDLGVSISLDDFGTGYSSLSYLRQFPVDYLKLDRTFIKNLAVSDKDMAITVAISNLARSLSMGLVAEGVEERQHLEFLRRHGCQEAQGFLFSRPVPAEQINVLLGIPGCLGGT